MAPHSLQAGFGSFAALLQHWAQQRPEHIALRDSERELSWAALDEAVERIAAQLLLSGLERGQSVAILGSSNVNYALVFLAAIRAGGVAAPLTTSASPEQLLGMAKDSGARHLFIDAAKRAELGEDFLPALTHIPLEALDAWMAPAGTRAPGCEPAPEDPFNIIYSSGTTGVPKGIVHSHQMRWRQFAALAAGLVEAGIPLRSLTSTPLYSNTTMIAFLPVLYAGGTVSIMSRFNTLGWLEAAERHAITLTILVPVQYQRLMDEPRFDDFDLSALMLKYCTSAPFSAALKEQVLRRMPGGLIEIYSMTEGGVVCLLPCHEFPHKLHTVGRPAPGSELKVLDDEDRPVPAGAPGHLVGRSLTMMSGYMNQPEKTREGYWTDPQTGEVWQRMGDIGRVDEDGFVELVGRAKDMIISGGFNIYPSDLETELEKDPRVAEAAVIGVASARWGETPFGFVRLAQGVAPDEVSEILATVNARLGKTQRLAALEPIAEMPRSHIGKLLKTTLRERVAASGRVF